MDPSSWDTKEKILAVVKGNMMTSVTTGSRMDIEAVLGGLTKDSNDMITGATVITLGFLLNNVEVEASDGEFRDERAEAWEEEWLNQVEDLEVDNITFSWFSFRSFADEFGTAIEGDIQLLQIAILCNVVFANIQLTQWNKVRRRVGLWLAPLPGRPSFQAPLTDSAGRVTGVPWQPRARGDRGHRGGGSGSDERIRRVCRHRHHVQPAHERATVPYAGHRCGRHVRHRQQLRPHARICTHGPARGGGESLSHLSLVSSFFTVPNAPVVLCAGFFTNTKRNLTRGFCMGLQALSHAGPSITLTSLTDFAAFMIGSLTSLPALAAFCQYAAVGVLFCFILQVGFFTSILAFDASKKNGENCCCCREPCAVRLPFASFGRMTRILVLCR